MNEPDIQIKLDINTSGVITSGQWYDLYLKLDGSSVEVWRALSGQAKTLVLSTTQAGVLSSVKFALQEMANYYAQIDDVVMTVPDPVTTINQYNTANELTSQASGGVTTTFTYDAWGRLVTKNQGSYQARYGYRFGDKLKDVTSNFPGEAATVYYNYDGLGKRRNRTLDQTNVTWWRWDVGWNALQEYADPDADWDVENLSMTYIPGLAEVPGTTPSTGSYRYYMGDHLGSVRTMRDQNNAALASYEYMPYGETYSQSGLALNKGFTGHTWDKDDGLYYAPFRYYSPVASRWLTRDPLGMVDGPNVYTFCGDAPNMNIDQLGLSVWDSSKLALLWSLIGSCGLWGFMRAAFGPQGNSTQHCVFGCQFSKCSGDTGLLSFLINLLYENHSGPYKGDWREDTKAAFYGANQCSSSCDANCADCCSKAYPPHPN